MQPPTERHEPGQVLRSPALHIIFGVTLTGVMGVASITPVLPAIGEVFDLRPEQTSLLIILFTLPGIFLTPVFGILADLYGRKRVLVPVLFIFAIFGTACFFAPSFEMLLFFRFMQGVGAASLGAMNVTMISDLFHGNQRTAALGYNSGVLSFGATMYPAIGGALSIIGWRYPFLLPILAVPTGLLVLFRLNLPQKRKKIDLKRYLRGVANSLNSRKIRTMFLLSTSTFLLVYGPILTFLPFYMEHFFDSTPLAIGIVIASMSIGNLISGAMLGYLSMYFKTIELLLISYLLVALSLLLIPAMPTPLAIMLPCVIFGFAIGINNPNIQTLIAKTVRPQQRAAILSINGMVLRLGQTIGPLIMTLFFVISGYTGAYIMAAGFSILIYFYLKSLV